MLVLPSWAVAGTSPPPKAAPSGSAAVAPRAMRPPRGRAGDRKSWTAPSPLQRGTVPAGQLRPSLVRTLGELEQHGIRVGGGAYRLVGQNKFAELATICRGGWPNRGVGEAGRFGRHVRIIRRLLDGASQCARPEAAAAHLVRIRFAGDTVGSGPLWRASARKSGYREIEGAPEEVHRAAFADEASAKLLQHTV